MGTSTMLARKIAPDRQALAKQFVSILVDFLKQELGQDSYNDLRIQDPFKNISQDYLHIINLRSLNETKPLKQVFKVLKNAGIEVRDQTPSSSSQLVYPEWSHLKIGLSLPESLLRKYGDEDVLAYCNNYGQTKRKVRHSDLTLRTISELELYVESLARNFRGKVISVFFKNRLKEIGMTEYRVLSRGSYSYQGHIPQFVVLFTNAPDAARALNLFESLGCQVDIADTVQPNIVRVKKFSKTTELIPASEIGRFIASIKGLEGSARTMEVKRFFMRHLPKDCNPTVLPRTWLHLLVKETQRSPEFVVEFRRSSTAKQVFEIFKSLGVDVDIIGRESNVVRVKNLLVQQETQQTKTFQKLDQEILPQIDLFPMKEARPQENSASVAALLDKFFREKGTLKEDFSSEEDSLPVNETGEKKSVSRVLNLWQDQDSLPLASQVPIFVRDLGKSIVEESFEPQFGIEHRLETFAMIEGVLYVNDSKATNVNSVWYTLETLKGPIIWICGGVDKGNDYTSLVPLVKEKVKGIVYLAENSSKIRNAFSHLNLPFLETESIVKAVGQARYWSTEGDSVVLSPSCPSFDLFENYEDKGCQFKQVVKSL